MEEGCEILVFGNMHFTFAEPFPFDLISFFETEPEPLPSCGCSQRV